MGAMTREHDDTVTYRGARFEGTDFNGATFRDCDLRGVKVVDAWLVDTNISGLVGNLTVNDVDVTAFVEAELDRRNPERARVRQMRTADEYRKRCACWARDARSEEGAGELVVAVGPSDTPVGIETET
jgi:Pentapeptide repeats (8 copies)